MVRLVRLNTLGGLLLGMSLSLMTPALSHTVKISEDVAATFHIEPNHNPKVGQPSQAWFALTQRGGKVIPLAHCNCKLRVYLNPHAKGDDPTIEPVLKPISTAQYQNVPGAEITFAKPGAYELEISGVPHAGAKFQPFALRYEVTVMAGPMAQTAIAKPTQATQSKNVAAPQTVSDSVWSGIAIIGLGVMGVAVLGYTLGWKK